MLNRIQPTMPNSSRRPTTTPRAFGPFGSSGSRSTVGVRHHSSSPDWMRFSVLAELPGARQEGAGQVTRRWQALAGMIYDYRIRWAASRAGTIEA